MLGKIFYTTILVSDQERALDFYTNILGLEQRVDNPTPDGPRFLTVGVSGQDFQLVLWPRTPGQAQPTQGRIPPACTIETDDLRKEYEALKSRGVEVRDGCARVPVGLRRAVRGSRREPAAASGRPLSEDAVRRHDEETARVMTM